MPVYRFGVFQLCLNLLALQSGPLALTQGWRVVFKKSLP